MNSQRTGLRLAAVVLAIFAIGHAVRLLKQIKVVIGSHEIPMGLSWIALVVAVFLCAWMWRLASAAR